MSFCPSTLAPVPASASVPKFNKYFVIVMVYQVDLNLLPLGSLILETFLYNFDETSCDRRRKLECFRVPCV